MKIGFIGLGIMGSRMATNLQKAGFELVVHNRTKTKADDLLAGGATWADSSAAVAQQVELLFTMLGDPEAVLSSAMGDDGFLDNLPTGSLWVDCSTVNPSFTRTMANHAAERGLRFLDAPVAGTKQPAESGELLFLVGGDTADIETARPCFEAMGRAVQHVGGHAAGTSIKMVVNKMLAEAMLSFAEALTLGESLGISRDVLLGMVPNSAIAAPFLKSKAEKIAAADFEADFPLQWMQKDLQLATVTGYEQGVSLPLANVAKEIYGLARQNGLGDDDFSAIYRFISETK
jgi:3-hydroxyisobutyrate dehydrogenase/glyoxylate/succinic semialdehyde reductase